MSITRPHVQSFTRARPPRQRPEINGIAKSVLTASEHASTVSGKVEFTDNLTNLDNFVTVTGAPTIASGMLTATRFSVTRCKVPLLTDDCEVSATIGATGSGKSRIMFFGDDNFASWYGLEVEQSLFSNRWYICRGINIFDCAKSNVVQSTSVNDVAKIRYDRAAGLLRMYRNGAQLATVPVPSKGQRNWALATGIDGAFNPGPRFTSVTAKDI